jgi:hypothetical protein
MLDGLLWLLEVPTAELLAEGASVSRDDGRFAVVRRIASRLQESCARSRKESRRGLRPLLLEVEGNGCAADGGVGEPLRGKDFGETRSRTASTVRNSVTSRAPISAGWRLAWKKMYRLVQCTYAFSVRRLKWRARTAPRTRSRGGTGRPDADWTLERPRRRAAPSDTRPAWGLNGDVSTAPGCGTPAEPRLLPSKHCAPPSLLVAEIGHYLRIDH